MKLLKSEVVTTTSQGARFELVDGGVGRACRGETPGDNSAGYYRAAGHWKRGLQEALSGSACIESTIQGDYWDNA